MKVLSLDQYWASLVAKGHKTIETRSWSTKHRGEMGIHATVKIPRIPKWKVAHPDAAAVKAHELGVCYCGHDAEMCMRLGLCTLKRGAIIATCNLVDVVPMREVREGGSGLILDFPTEGNEPHQQGGLWLIGVNGKTHGTPTRVEDQRPYGDFAPGRHAWLLDDITEIEPIYVGGHQRLWNWTDT